jgi:hypothetical protein
VTEFERHGKVSSTNLINASGMEGITQERIVEGMTGHIVTTYPE